MLRAHDAQLNNRNTLRIINQTTVFRVQPSLPNIGGVCTMSPRLRAQHRERERERERERADAAAERPKSASSDTDPSLAALLLD